jgi:hypothetical protein
MYKSASKFTQEAARRAAGLYRPGNAKLPTQKAKDFVGIIRKNLGPEEIEHMALRRFGKPHDRLTPKQARQLLHEAQAASRKIVEHRKEERRRGLRAKPLDTTDA